MKTNLKLLFAAVLVGILVVLVYIIFEESVKWAIDAVWLEAFDIETNRYLAVLLTIGFGMVYFTAVRYLDNKDEIKRRPPAVEMVFVLLIGFMSLFSGASLGPEAILIPSSLLAGTVITTRLKMKKEADFLGFVGFVVLFVAFFSALWGGLLGYYLANKNKKLSLKPCEIGILIVSVLASYGLLQLLSRKGSFLFPKAEHTFSATNLFLIVLFLLSGMVIQRLLFYSIQIFSKLKKRVDGDWLVEAIVASAGLAFLFFIGGYFVQFTGNEFIAPLLKQASGLGLLSLIWIAFIKVLTIAWSRSLGYRGGMVFPLVLVSSSVVAIATLYLSDFNAVVGIFAVLFGALIADRKQKVITGSMAE